MYRDGYAISVIVKDKILNETKDRNVYVPFGEEFKVRLINKNNTKARANLYLNGEEVGKFIVEANGKIDIERWLDGSNDSGKKFQFVSLNNKKVSDKQSFENGVVEVQWFKEIPPLFNTPIIIEKHIHHHDNYPPYPYLQPSPFYGFTVGDPGFDNKFYCSTSNQENINLCTSKNSPTRGMLAGAEGSAVRGSESKQKFQTVTGLIFDSVATILKLKILQGNIIPAVIYCSSCGRKKKDNDNFCPKCGNKFA